METCSAEVCRTYEKVALKDRTPHQSFSPRYSHPYKNQNPGVRGRGLSARRGIIDPAKLARVAGLPEYHYDPVTNPEQSRTRPFLAYFLSRSVPTAKGLSTRLGTVECLWVWEALRDRDNISHSLFVRRRFLESSPILTLRSLSVDEMLTSSRFSHNV
jgi:hypothetical protein